MLDPTSLFSYERGVDSRSIQASTLIVTLGSFADSGNVQRNLNEHIAQSAPSRLIGTFDADQLIDYTGARPEITLDVDHFVDYRKPALELIEVSPADAPPYLVLKGPEPNFQWERATSAVRIVIEQLGVTRTVIVSSFPGASPHTRPLHVTRFAGDPQDLTIASPLPGSVEGRAAFSSVLTMRLAEAGHSVVGLVAHIPSYAHEMDYFPAIPPMLTAIETAGGPRIDDSDRLHEQVAQTRAMLDRAMEDNEQLRGLVAGFEDNYARMDDAIARITPQRSAPIPGAENLTDEVEDFLRDLTDQDPRDEPGV